MNQKWRKACDKLLNRLIPYIHDTQEYNVFLMVVILQHNAGWHCFKTLTLREVLKIRNILLEEQCAFLDVIILFQ